MTLRVFIMYSIVMISFSFLMAEIAGLSLTKQNYINSFWFWLDLIGTISILFGTHYFI